jgi:HEAT repeat protein
MGDETAKRIRELIDELRVNDKKRASEYKRRPKEPKEAMNELVKIGRLAVNPLLELLKNTSRYSCLYAIKVLGEIGDPAAVQPIIEAFSNESFLDEFAELADYEQPVVALQRIGLPALEPTLAFLKKKRDEDDNIGIYQALEILAGIKDEKSFEALVDMLSHPDSEAQINAVEWLGKYGDKRAVQHLKNLLENVDVEDYVAEAIQKLVSVQEYRNIIAPYVLKRLKSFSSEISQNLRNLEYAHEYPPHFEGDEAEELNTIALEQKIRESVENLLDKTLQLGVYEAVIPDALKKELNRKLWKVRGKWERFKLEHEEEVDIVKGRIPAEVVKETTKSYKGLASPSSWGPQPKLDELRTKIWEWLKNQKFLVTKEYSHLWARKGTKDSRKGCYVAVVKDDERGRTWGLVHLNLWGKGWSQKEAEKFTKSFWEYTEGIIAGLVVKKKLQIQAVKD